jgi:heat shock protein HslJ
MRSAIISKLSILTMFIVCLFLVSVANTYVYSQDDYIPPPTCVCAECNKKCGTGHESSCSSANKSLMDDPIITNKELAGKWIFKTIGGNEIVKEKAGKIFPFVIFKTANGSISGNTGCNEFNGNVTESSGAMSFSSMTTTKMFCSDASYETEITSVFFSKNQFKYKMDDGLLSITKDEKELMTLVKSE